MSTSQQTLTSPITKDGAFVRPESQFRSSISSEPGAKFPPEKGRYHLYVSYGCPWAHRTLIVRALKGLEDIIPATAMHPRLPFEASGMRTTGWRFIRPDESVAGELSHPDPVHDDAKELKDLYLKASPGFAGRWTVPVLWDTKTETIVNNESSEIIRMLNTAFNSLLPEKFRDVDLYPEPLRAEIDEANDWIYHNINNGVYKAGFATTQEPYDKAVKALFEHLDRAEEHLSKSPGPYFFGKDLTETDVRLYVTIARFDVAYHTFFKCNIRDIRSGYPAIHRWLRHTYWDNPAFKGTTHFDLIKEGYMTSHLFIMPAGIISAGPFPHILPKDQEVAATTVTTR